MINSLLTHLIFTALVYQLVVNASRLNGINQIHNDLCIADGRVYKAFYARLLAS